MSSLVKFIPIATSWCGVRSAGATVLLISVFTVSLRRCAHLGLASKAYERGQRRPRGVARRQGRGRRGVAVFLYKRSRGEAPAHGLVVEAYDAAHFRLDLKTAKLSHFTCFKLMTPCSWMGVFSRIYI